MRATDEGLPLSWGPDGPIVWPPHPDPSPTGRRVTDVPWDPFDELVQAIAWELYLDGIHRRSGPTPLERSARVYLMARQRRQWDIPALCSALGACPHQQSTALLQSPDDDRRQAGPASLVS